jgi:Tol biopolymer transport system component
VQIAPPADVLYKGTTFAPDGQHVYFTASDARNPLGALYRVPVLGGTPRRILERIQSPVGFSPDGGQLAFVRHDDAQGADELVVAAADGSGQRVIAIRRGIDWFEEDGPAWSPDGEHVACAAGTDRGGTHMTLLAVPAGGGAARLLSTHRWSSVGRVTWSGDGASIFVVAAEAADASNVGTMAQVWRIAATGGEATRITNDLSGYSHRTLAATADGSAILAVREDASSRVWEVDLGGAEPAARPLTDGKLDGRSGLDWTPAGELVYAARGGQQEDLWLLGRDGAPPRQLTEDAADESDPAVAPDGRQLLFTSARGGVEQVWHLALDGSPPRPLTAGPAISVEPSWSPDGRWLAFSSWRGGFVALWRMPVAGGTPQQLTFDPTNKTQPAYSPDGKQIALTVWDYSVQFWMVSSKR